jgi:ABC-type branched-subunit amino acid transport system substrate-binding protein
MRHRWLAAVVLVALVASVGAPTAIVAQTGPIRIGLLAPLSGAFSATGKDMLAGTELPLYSRDYPPCTSC